MAIDIDVAVDQKSLTNAENVGRDELRKSEWKETTNDCYNFALLRNALAEPTDEAWSVFQQCFSETIRVWIYRHPGRDVALARDSVENYVAQTFSRFWCAIRDQHIEFTNLPSALSYLRATLNGIIVDTLRSHLRARLREVPILESGVYQEPVVEDAIESQNTWDSIKTLLTDKRESRLAYLLYYCGLKPRDIVKHCAEEFDDVKEVYRLSHNIVEKLRRNQDRLRHLLNCAV